MRRSCKTNEEIELESFNLCVLKEYFDDSFELFLRAKSVTWHVVNAKSFFWRNTMTVFQRREHSMKNALSHGKFVFVDYPLGPETILHQCLFLCFVVVVVFHRIGWAEEIQKLVETDRAWTIFIHRCECLEQHVSLQSEIELAKAVHKLLDADFFWVAVDKLCEDSYRVLTFLTFDFLKDLTKNLHAPADLKR